MINFTELRNRAVVTEDGIVVGGLVDLVFAARQIPEVLKLHVKSAEPGVAALFIPIRYLQSINNPLTIDKNYTIDSLRKNELFVMKNLIDKQIIDIEGRKVVRVNDVMLSKKRKNFLIVGVDTGFLGVLRWIGLENAAKALLALMGRNIESSFLPWSAIQPLELTEGKVVLNVNQNKIEKLLPEDVADYLEATTMDNIIRTINLLDPDFAADVVAELNLNYQLQLLKEVSLKAAAKIISLMDPDEAVDVLAEFSSQRRLALLGNLNPDKRAELERLLNFVGDGVGDYLTTEFLTVSRTDYARAVIEKIKGEGKNISFMTYIYVINPKGQLDGVFTLHELLLENPNAAVDQFAHGNPVTIHLRTPLSVVQRKMIKYKLAAIPIVDRFRNIVGIVTFDDIGEFFLDKSIGSEEE